MVATAKEMLTNISAGYVPSHGHSLIGRRHYFRNKPIFTLRAVQEMMDDARVRFGIEMLKGPILANSQFQIKVDKVPEGIREEVRTFLIDNVTRFWRNSADRSLTSIPWGRSGNEVLYKPEGGYIQFDILKGFHALDTKAMTLKGKFVGMHVYGKGREPLYIGTPKAFWTIHWRDMHPWYGKSRLYASFQPWVEKWTDGGYRDTRRLYWHKYAYDGGIMIHPTGSTKNDDGTEIPNKDLARELIEKKKTGGTLTLPRSQDGAQMWELLPPNVPAAPVGLEDYGTSLDEEILEGMGIPPEVAKAVGTGAFAGRRIPMQGFQATLSMIVHWLMSDATQQIFRPLVELNFGPDIPFDVVPFGLLKKAGAQGQWDTPDPEGEQAGDLGGGQEMSLSDITNHLFTPNYQSVIAA